MTPGGVKNSIEFDFSPLNSPMANNSAAEFLFVLIRQVARWLETGVILGSISGLGAIFGQPCNFS